MLDVAHDRSLAAKLIKEVRLASLFRHPSIVQYLGTSTDPADDTKLMLVTELCDFSLYDLLHHSGPAAARKNPKLTWDSRARIALDVSEGMCYLHDVQQMLHLDLKSPNVVFKGKVAKVTDFGSLQRIKRPPSASPAAIADQLSHASSIGSSTATQEVRIDSVEAPACESTGIPAGPAPYARVCPCLL